VNRIPGIPAAPAPAAAPPRALRLLQVLGYAGRGGERYGITGVERVVQILLEGLAPTRYEHYVAYPGVGACFESYRRRAQVLDIAPQRRWDPRYIEALVRSIRTNHVDLVVSHGLRFDFLAQHACRRTRTPHVVVRAVALADETMPIWAKRIYGLADRWTLGACSGIVAVSEASKQRMVLTQKLPATKIVVIPNGVRLPHIGPRERAAARRALGVADRVPLVGGVGQLIPRKAFHVLVEALGMLRERHPRAESVILGEGPERALLEARARALGVPLHLPGFLVDPYPAFASFDVAVLPSRAEGMPLVVLEAMALEVACVATPAAGTVELIEDGRSGFLFPMDDPGALASVLDRLLADEALRARIAAAGRERAHRHFGLEAMLARFDAYLHGAAGWPAP
jgi:glycosyltransferase involved in cell wall biosynthesis